MKCERYIYKYIYLRDYYYYYWWWYNDLILQLLEKKILDYNLCNTMHACLSSLSMSTSSINIYMYKVNI
jgi:hypothetical protein